MAKLDINSITIVQFCDLQGINPADRFVLIKKYKEEIKSYDNWYDFLKKDFQLSQKKDFPTAKKNNK